MKRKVLDLFIAAGIILKQMMEIELMGLETLSGERLHNNWEVHDIAPGGFPGRPAKVPAVSPGPIAGPGPVSGPAILPDDLSTSRRPPSRCGVLVSSS